MEVVAGIGGYRRWKKMEDESGEVLLTLGGRRGEEVGGGVRVSLHLLKQASLERQRDNVKVL